MNTYGRTVWSHYCVLRSKTLLRLNILPTIIDRLDFIWLMWFFQFDDSSTRKHNNFVSRILNIRVFFILIFIVYQTIKCI